MALEEVKSMLRAVLMSCKEGVPAYVLQKDYREITQEPLPFLKLGFANLDDFINSIPDVVRVRRNKQGEMVYHAVANEETAHIQQLVSKQRSTKKKKTLKPARRRPMRRPEPPKPFVPFGSSKPSPRGRPPPWGQKVYPPRSPPWKPRPPLLGQSPLSIQVNMNKGRGRRVTINRAFNEAVTAATKPRQMSESGQFGPKFEIPPRFQKQQEGKENNVPFENIDPGRQKSDVFESISESEFAAASAAVKGLGLQTSSEKPHSQSPVRSDDLKVKTRVRELMKGKTNGIWGTRLEVIYKEVYHEDPPANLMYLIQKWPDVVRVEEHTNIGRILLYPVSDEQRLKNLQESIKPPSTVGGASSQQNDSPAVHPDKTKVPAVVSPKIKELNIPAGENLPIGEKMTVFTTLVGEDGSFCVQHKDSAIFQIEEVISSVANSPVPDLEDLMPGRFIAALYTTEGESSWSRAEIINRQGTTVEVLFIDYGNTASCSQNSTRFLTEELAQYPMQNIYCYLNGVAPLLQDEDTWSKKFKERFAEIVSDKELIAITREILMDGTHVVDLYLSSDPSQSINMRLVAEGILQEVTAEDAGPGDEEEPDELELPSDTNQWDIYVSFINSSTNSVMIRLVGENYSDKLEELERKLEDAFHAAGDDVPEIREGQVCVAYVDGLFHRVRAIKKETRNGDQIFKYQCYFLDHGDSDGLIPDQLRILDPKINKLLPYQAFEVSMEGLEGFAENVTTLEKLFDMALGKTLIAEVTPRADSFSIVMYDTQGDNDININQEILKAVQQEAETSLLTSSGSNPQSTESSPLPLRRVAETTATTATSSASSSPLTLSPKRQPQTTPTPVPAASEFPKKSIVSESNVADSGEIESGEGSWETEEEEVIEGVGTGKSSTTSKQKSTPQRNQRQTDLKAAQVTKPLKSKPESTPVKNLTEKLSCLSTQDTGISGDSSAVRGNSDHQNPEAPNLYTWGASGDSPSPSPGIPSSENDQIALCDVQVYNTRPVPKKFAIPPRGEYCDIHIINVFDPTNFACIPFQHMSELNDLLSNMIEHFNSVEDKVTLKSSDLREGQMYAGRKEGAWYRVIFKNVIRADNASVYLADFGEFTGMRIDAIKLLPFCFTKLPQLAIKGKLYGIKPAKDSQVWSEAAKYKFVQMAHNKSLVGLVCGREETPAGEVVAMRLVDTETDRDMCLDEELLQLGVADKIR
ncbi:tudor domain-containing protein 7-like isoform X3 [Crassostrea virginica]